MTDNVENLTLEHLKRFQTTLERIDQKLGELTTRQSETHAAVLGLRRDAVNDAEIVGHLQVQLDGVRDRLERIERRLDLAN
jgi:chromosome segregation ATPase